MSGGQNDTDRCAESHLNAGSVPVSIRERLTVEPGGPGKRKFWYTADSLESAGA